MTKKDIHHAVQTVWPKVSFEVEVWEGYAPEHFDQSLCWDTYTVRPTHSHYEWEITFDHLEQLSSILSTKKIDIYYRPSEPDYSEDTPGASEDMYLRVYISTQPAPAEDY